AHFLYTHRPPPNSTLFPYTTLFRSQSASSARRSQQWPGLERVSRHDRRRSRPSAEGNTGWTNRRPSHCCASLRGIRRQVGKWPRSEEHTSELQSPYDLVCRLLLEKK